MRKWLLPFGAGVACASVALNSRQWRREAQLSNLPQGSDEDRDADEGAESNGGPAWLDSDFRRRLGLPATEQRLRKRHFVASVDYARRQPRWVLECLTPVTFPTKEQANAVSRDGVQFFADGQVPAPFRADSGDYWRSGWSRGHLCPAGILFLIDIA